MDTKFISEDGLKNLAGRVTPKIVDQGDWYALQWECPFCSEQLAMDAVEFMTDFVIEDGRTGFAHCIGRDYAVIVPRLLPDDFWTKVKLNPTSRVEYKQ